MTKLPPRVLVLDGDTVITGNGRAVPAPETADPRDLLPRLLGALGDNGQILITGAPGWDHLTEPGLSGDWTVTGSAGWMTARNGNSRLRIGKIPHIEVKNNPLLKGDPDLISIAVRHQLYASMTGVPFYADGGTSALLLLDRVAAVRGREPLRKLPDDPRAPRCREDGWPSSSGWAADGQRVGSLTVDRNAQYLAGVSGVYVPLDAPELTGPIAYDGRRAGLWHIITPDNPEPRLPHPCGTSARPGEPRWFAHPTTDLLGQLGAPVKVLDSWTLPRERCRRLLDPWAEALRDARAELVGHDDPDSIALLEAVKDTYSRGLSHLDKGSERRWYRHDWKAIYFSSARTRMWRSINTAGIAGGVWPVRISTDSVTYESAAAGAALKIGNRVGEWKVR
jgi:hypothetical protein